MNTIQTSQLSLLILAFSLYLGGLAYAEDKPTFDIEPLNVNDLAEILGVKKSGFRVQLPEVSHVRLVAEITINGKVRKEFAELKDPVKEFSAAAFTEHEPNTSSFRRITFGVTSGGGAEAWHVINDFRRASLRHSSTSLANSSVTYRYSFWTDPGMPSVKPTELGSVKIHLETSVAPFASVQNK